MAQSTGREEGCVKTAGGAGKGGRGGGGALGGAGAEPLLGVALAEGAGGGVGSGVGLEEAGL
jgi:hypothetical protein